MPDPDSTIDLIIFDCDGTLVDSEPITNRVIAQYVSEFGLAMHEDEALHLFTGRDMPGIVKTLEARLRRSLPAEFVPEFRRRQAAALKTGLQEIEGATTMLDAIAKDICLASNAPRDKIAINLSVTKLKRFFSDERIFSAYDIQRWKPHPDLFLHAAKQLNVAPDRCLVLEDSEAGVEAALSAGMQVVCFAGDQPPASTKVPVINELSEFLAWC